MQIVEFDVDQDASSDPIGVAAARRRRSRRTRRSRAIIRGDDDDPSRAATRRSSRATASSSSARRGPRRRGARCCRPAERRVRDVVVYGAGRVGTAIARVLLDQGISVRMIEASREQRARGRRGAAEGARLQRDRDSTRTSSSASASGRRRPAIFAMRDDAKNLYAATLAKVHGVPFTIAIAHERGLRRARSSRSGIDVSVNPRAGDRRGDRPLRARPTHAAGRDARGRPLRGARRDDAPSRARTSARRSATCRSAAR